MADAPEPGQTGAGTPAPSAAPVTPAAPVAPVTPPPASGLGDPPPPPPAASPSATSAPAGPPPVAATPRPAAPPASTSPASTSPPPRATTTTTTTTQAGSPKPDWTTQVAGQIDSLVETIRSNTSDRLVRVARMIVYGLLVAVMGAMAVIVSVIGTIRVLDRILPYEVWLPYLVLGAIFLAAGLFLWSKRTASPAGP